MKKIGLIMMVVFVAVMFASVAVAATSTSCSSGCGSCAKPSCAKASCNTCAKPCVKAACNTCAKPASCACKQIVVEYKRDVLGNKVPVYTYAGGDANTDTATGYEATLVSGN